MRKYRPLAVILGAGILLMLACAAYVLIADKWCPLESSNTVPYLGEVKYRQSHEGKARTHAQNYRKYDKMEPRQTVSLLTFLQAHAEDNKSNPHSPNNQGKHPSWLTKFLCDSKLGDIALVFFTGCLVLVTGWLVWVTIGLQEVTRLLAQHVPIVERAYVSGGGYFPTEIRSRGRKERSERFLLTVDNYGKTPAYVTHVKIGFWRMEQGPLPDPPPYESCCEYPLAAVVPPGKED